MTIDVENRPETHDSDLTCHVISQLSGIEDFERKRAISELWSTVYREFDPMVVPDVYESDVLKNYK